MEIGNVSYVYSQIFVILNIKFFLLFIKKIQTYREVGK